MSIVVVIIIIIILLLLSLYLHSADGAKDTRSHSFILGNNSGLHLKDLCNQTQPSKLMPLKFLYLKFIKSMTNSVACCELVRLCVAGLIMCESFHQALHRLNMPNLRG